MTDYIEFLKTKIKTAPESGFEVEDFQLSPILKPHQRDAVKWAVKGGRRALFESFGLGKTLQQLEIIRLVIAREGGKGLIVCPLEVVDEFTEHAEMLGMTSEYCRTMAAADASQAQVIVTNYERVRDGDIDPARFIVASLDEASVLRSFGSKTYQTFLDKFHGVRFKFVATATPSPNSFKELIHYAGYLEIMDTGQALTRFFQRDSTKANNLTLYPHKEEEFWLWLSTWALFITSPADLGYDATGYDLPPLDVRYHRVGADHSTAGFDDHGQGKLIRDASIGLKDAAREKRDSIGTRVEKMMEIIKSDPEAHFILWHDLESERHSIKKALPEAAEIYGSQDEDARAAHAHGFKKGTVKYLATKPDISGQGCNFQYHCHRAIFVGIGYKFNDFVQAIHRVYRFLQHEQVIIDIIYTESEQSVLDALKTKWSQHEKLVENMTKIIREFGLASTDAMDKLARSIGVHRRVAEGKRWRVVNNDTVLETAAMESNSVDMIVTSIPFANHYEYTPSYNDFGHTESNDHFWRQMDFLTPELLRVIRPGRVAAIHVKDRILFGNATGFGMPTADSFHEETSLHFQKHGFKKIGMITIITDVVRENNQTYRLGWTEQCKDGTKMGVGCPEYVLLFRKMPSDNSRAYADVPAEKRKPDCLDADGNRVPWYRGGKEIQGDGYSRGQWQLDAHGFWRSSGNRLLTAEELAKVPVEQLQKIYREYSRETIYSYEEHVALANALGAADKLPSSFMVVAPGSWDDDAWDDVNRMLCLNTQQAQKGAEMHVCPLQFDTVNRLINRFTNPGETIFDPFGGLFTVPYCALQLGRKGVANELNSGYFDDGVGYLKAKEREMLVPDLFDGLGIGA